MSILEWLPWNRARRSDELAEEIRTHLEMAERERIARGESPVDAAANARREFGSVGLATELARDQWGRVGLWIEHLTQDVSFALRMLRRTPAFTVAAVLTIAVGVGGSTALFSVVNATLLRPLPFPHAGQLVRIEDDYVGVGSSDVGMSTPEWHDLERSGIFDYVSPVWFDNNNLTGLARPQRVSLLIVASNYFAMLGVRPQLGVTFDPADHTLGFNEQAVISDGLWKRAFGRDSTVVGRLIRLDTDLYRIVGIMPPGFQAPGKVREERDTEVWVAFGFAGAPLNAATVESRASLFFGAEARVKAGVTIAKAQQRVDALVGSLRRQYPADYPPSRDWRVRLVPLASSVAGDVGRPLTFLLAAVAMVLVIGCANIANLLLARASTRGREIGIRQALGGAPSRIVRQLLTESVVLAFVGGVLGVAIVVASRGSLLRLVPDSVPRLNEISIDWSVLTFALLASLIAGVFFGLAPALRVRRVDVTRVLRQEGRGMTSAADQRRTRRYLVVAEFALSLVLLSACGLLARSMWDLLHAPLGFDPRSVTVIRTRLPYPNDPSQDRYGTPVDEARFVREVIRHVQTLPRVRDVALGSGAAVPLDHPSQDQTVFHLVFERMQGNADQIALVSGSEVTPSYFGVLGMSLVRGRLFDDHDVDDTPSVVVINEAMARRYWPNQDAIGQRFKLSPRAPAWSTVIGIAADARTESLTGAAEPQVYSSLYQRVGKHLAVFVNGHSDISTLDRQVREQVQSIDPTLPVFGAQTLNDTVSGAVAVRRLSLELVASFAFVALLLSALGMYGVMSYTMTERTHEIGVRLALGAQQSEVMHMLMRQGMTMAIAGATIGIVGALFVSRVLAGLVAGVRHFDPVAISLAAVALASVAVLGCYLPARRAVRSDPVRALRA